MLRFIYKISNDLRRLGYVPNDERIRIRVAEGYWSIKVTCSPRKSCCKLLSTQQINFFRLNYLDFQIDRDLCSKLFQIMLYLQCTPITMTSGLGGFKYPNDPQNFNAHHDELIDFAIDINQSWATSRVKQQQTKNAHLVFMFQYFNMPNKKCQQCLLCVKLKTPKTNTTNKSPRNPKKSFILLQFFENNRTPINHLPPLIPGARNGKVDPSIKR